MQKNPRSITIFVQKWRPFKDCLFSRLLHKNTSNCTLFIKQIFAYFPFKVVPPPYSTNFWNMKAIELIFFALYSSCLIWIIKFFPFLTDFNFSPVFRDLMLTWVKNGAQDISRTLRSIWLIFLHKILVTIPLKISHGIRDISIFHWNIENLNFWKKNPSVD